MYHNIDQVSMFEVLLLILILGLPDRKLPLKICGDEVVILILTKIDMVLQILVIGNDRVLMVGMYHQLMKYEH
jgi:hypothetical protein